MDIYTPTMIWTWQIIIFPVVTCSVSAALDCLPPVAQIPHQFGEKEHLTTFHFHFLSWHSVFFRYNILHHATVTLVSHFQLDVTFVLRALSCRTAHDVWRKRYSIGIGCLCHRIAWRVRGETNELQQDAVCDIDENRVWGRYCQYGSLTIHCLAFGFASFPWGFHRPFDVFVAASLSPAVSSLDLTVSLFSFVSIVSASSASSLRRYFVFPYRLNSL